MKTELNEWQKKHVKDDGLLVIMLQGGQVRRYGETISLYEVFDVYQQYTKDEVLKLCAEKVERAEIPEKITGYLSLSVTVLSFEQKTPHCYLYKCGHDYTD